MRKIANKNKVMKYVEITQGEELEEVLHKLYIVQGKNIREIADILDVHFNTISKWLKLAGIDMRMPHHKLLEIIEIKRKLEDKQDV